MPNFDGGHYFLTVLAPVRRHEIPDAGVSTFPLQALRARLANLHTVGSGPNGAGAADLFAGNHATHFARFAVIDDVAYNGRVNIDTMVAALVGKITGKGQIDAQPQDHLNRPFLLFTVEFDAANGSESERDAYLIGLWDSLTRPMREIFSFCFNFDERVKDARSFAAYIADCQIETTMSFNDYYAPSAQLPSWPVKPFLYFVVLLVAALLISLACLAILNAAWAGPSIAILLLALIATAGAAYVSVMRTGEKPFPTAPDTTLPSVLKALYLQRVFTRFAIDNQMLAAVSGEESSRKLFDAFAGFLAAHEPGNLSDKTQAPGALGI